MNRFYRSILTLAVMSAVEENAGGASNTPDAPAVELPPTPEPTVTGPLATPDSLAGKSPAIPDDPKTVAWKSAGNRIINAYLGAEQTVVTAEQSLENTRLNGLLEFASLESEEARIYAIGEMQTVLTHKGGGNIPKRHNNYLSEFRRVARTIKEGWQTQEDVIKLLSQPGTYPERVQRITTENSRKQVQQATVNQQPNQPKPAEPADAPKSDAPTSETGKADAPTADQPQQPAAGLSTVPPMPEIRSGQVESVAIDKVVQTIDVLAEENIEVVAAHFAKRCKLSNVPAYKEMAARMIQVLDAIGIKEVNEKDARKAA